MAHTKPEFGSGMTVSIDVWHEMNAANDRMNDITAPYYAEWPVGHGGNPLFLLPLMRDVLNER